MSQALGTLTPFVLIAVLIAILPFVLYLGFRILRESNKAISLPDAPLPVKPIPIMSDAERAFFHTLVKATANRYEIFPQIPLARIIAQSSGKISPKVWGILQNSRIDFVLAHPKFLGAVAVIELDDSSHAQAITRERDKIKERILRDAGIPLLRFQVGDKWDADEMCAQIEQLSVPMTTS